MTRIKWRGGEITGNLEIRVADYEEEFEGKTDSWQEVLIHGDPEGLRSFAELLIKIANLDQESQADLPVGAKEHYHLRPNLEVSKNSVEAVVGRLDAKGTGRFHDKFIAKDEAKPKPNKPRPL